MKKLLVTGASGLLGLNLCLDAAGSYEVTGLVNRHGLRGTPFRTVRADLSLPGEAALIIEALRPDFVVHTAALANLDACEQNPLLSARLNAELPGEIAEVCRRLGVRWVHISTDAVFDGARGGYSEVDEPNPLGVYARDKLAGEKAAASDPRALIARVNFFGWSLTGTRSLAEFFYYNLAAGKPVKGFTDVYFFPLLANHLGSILLEMLEKGMNGLYHVLSRECLSKYQFGVNLARRFGLDESLIMPTSVHDSGLAARRSPNLTLRVDKLEAALGRTMPGQAEEMDAFAKLWETGRPQQLKALLEG